jgi:hypothetical protein
MVTPHSRLPVTVLSGFLLKLDSNLVTFTNLLL